MSTTTTDQQMQAFIDRHVSTLAPLLKEAALAAWDLQTTSSEAAKERSAELGAQVARLLANKEDFTFLSDIPVSELTDPLLLRQHTLLTNAFLSHQMDEAVMEQMIRLELDIEEQFNTFRATVAGKQVSDNEIEEILIHSPDVALRQETWIASKKVGCAVRDRVLDLVRIRNREAKRLGFDNYYAMSLELQELNQSRLFELLDTLVAASDTVWNEYKRELDAHLATEFNTTPDQIFPWHHANRFFQEPGPGEANLDRFFAEKDLEALTSRFYTAINLPVDDLLAKADLYERPNKCQHAFCMDVDRLGDVRVLCNCRANERWMSTMLHEFGHAVYDKFTDHELPFLLREPAHILTTESIALFMGRLTKNADWLTRFADVEPEEATRIASSAQRELRDHLLVFMKWCCVMAYFERGLYADPDQDLDTLWWDLVERFQNLACPTEIRVPGMWASKIHLASAPVYYHNYLLGEMVASQLIHHIKTVVLAGESASEMVQSAKVGAYLKAKVFYPGSSMPWEDWLENATGERLIPAYFVQELQ